MVNKKNKWLLLLGGGALAIVAYLSLSKGQPPPSGNLHIRVNYPTHGSTNGSFPPGDYNVASGTIVVITAIAASGYSFFNWAWSPSNLVVQVSGTVLSITIPESGEATIYANFT